MFSYFFTRTKRRLRVAFVRAQSRGYFDRRNLLRTLGVSLVLIFSLLATPSPPAVSAEFTRFGEGGGVVAGSGTEEPPSRFAEPKYPVRIPDSPEMEPLTAQAALVLDGRNGKILYEKNASQKFPPASLTKVMTALVSLERYSLDEKLLVPDVCLVGLEGKAQMGLSAGEVLRVETLLYGLLVSSASDAACVLAWGAQTEGEFVALMNEKAAALELTATHFTNPVGFDGGDHYSSAWDMLILAQQAMKNPVFRKIVGTAEIEVHDALDRPTRWHALKSTNILLKELTGVTGVKTGRTTNAGECFVASWVWEEGEVFGVVLGSEDRFAEMKKLRGWIERVYQPTPSASF